ncbi:Hus1-like protein [Ascodesmis nigricans]|uniref:Checkpoint protein n=1 Tax=Ascodesmis nigricans TaxID=341454 RepID=A0A4S2N6M5_9PEZI|nr:Hus1-like protein [Ascodesmis nigricans]
MRFKTSVRNISTFIKLTSCLTPISKTCWLRLSEDEVRFVIHRGDHGTQVWATVSIGTLFDEYRITSANSNIINLEVPLSLLHRALRSCSAAVDAVLRLTKRASDGVPILCLTITTSISTLVTQEIPVRVLSAASVEGLREPEIGEADANICLPPLTQVRAIAERMMKLSSAGNDGKLILAANWKGEFLMRLEGGEMVKVESRWRDLQNPVTEDSDQQQDLSDEEASRFKQVRVDGREWVRLLKVGVLARKCVACFVEGRALVVYVWLTEEGDRDETVLTYYMASYSA